ncbi:methyltransferase domain-containing protein [Maribius pontilimi]|uniref:Methyltransferase domain-containing protein n=1 Tax=Palleronia pontilimi TaxID=1964209 RepID=A0A934IE99_9RHOB|nr:methyltransferase domain-containing protein [Palleronia pontilimi]MBJ3761577.1 methyltransferase domain-containing protein [Palleronia pontilimi]
MTQPPKLTDRARLAQNRARTRPDGLFLHDIAADQIKERLEEVNRTFTDIAIVTGQPDFWATRFPGATIVADDDALALPPERFDLVLHALALHWADDPVGQLVQCRRALRPDGLFMAVTFGGQTLSELRTILAEVETRQTGGLAPRVAPMAEIRDLGGLIQRAGLAQPVADSDTLRVSYPALTALLKDLRAMGEGNALAARHPKPLSRALLDSATRLYADSFPHPDDPARIRATFDMIFLSGWAPHESQQQPLRPGSAQTRLADALAAARDDSPQSGD